MSENNFSRNNLDQKIREQQRSSAIVVSYRLIFILASVGLLFLSLSIGLDSNYKWKSASPRVIMFGLTLLCLMLTFFYAIKRNLAQMSKIGAAKILDEHNHSLHRGVQSGLELSSDLGDPSNHFYQKSMEEIDENCKSFRSKLPWVKKVDIAILIVFLTSLSIHFYTNYSIQNHSFFQSRFFNPLRDYPFFILQDQSEQHQAIFQEKLMLKGSVNGILPENLKLVIYDESDAYSSQHEVDFILKPENESFFEADHQLLPEHSIKYYFEADQVRTELKEIEVLHRPKIKKIDLTITPPSYTKQEAKSMDHIPQYIRVLEGSQVELQYEFDKRIIEATLKDTDDQKSNSLPPLEIINSNQVLIAFKAVEDVSFEPNFLDEDELGLQHSMILNFLVYQDTPPEIISLESSDPEDINDSIEIEFKLEDDLGLEKAELVFQKIDETNEVVEWVIPIDLENQENKNLIEGEVSVDLSKFNLKEEDELSFTMRVEDSHESIESKQQNRIAQQDNQSSDQEGNLNQKQKDLSEKGQISESSAQKVQTEKQKENEKLNNKLALDKSLDKILEHLAEAQGVLLEKDLDDTKINQEINAAQEQTEQSLNDSKETKDKLNSISLNLVQEPLKEAKETFNTKDLETQPKVEQTFSKLDEAREQLMKMKSKLQSEITNEKMHQIAREYMEAMEKYDESLSKLQDDELLKSLMAKMKTPYQREQTNSVEQNMDDLGEMTHALEQDLEEVEKIKQKFLEMLAEDPALLSRYTEKKNQNVELYRDHLLELKKKQEGLHALNTSFNYMSQSESHSDADIQNLFMKEDILMKQLEVTKGLFNLIDRSKTWLPLEGDLRKSFEPINELNSEVMSKSQQLLMDLNKGQSEQSLESKLSELNQDFLESEKKFQKWCSENNRGETEVNNFCMNRQKDYFRLKTLINRNLEASHHLSEKDYHELFIDSQLAIVEETRELKDDLYQDLNIYRSLNPKINDAFVELDDELVDVVDETQIQIVEEYEDNLKIDEHQCFDQVNTGYAKSVEKLDNLINEIIKEMDNQKMAQKECPPMVLKNIDQIMNLLQEEPLQKISLGIPKNCSKCNNPSGSPSQSKKKDPSMASNEQPEKENNHSSQDKKESGEEQKGEGKEQDGEDRESSDGDKESGKEQKGESKEQDDEGRESNDGGKESGEEQKGEGKEQNGQDNVAGDGQKGSKESEMGQGQDGQSSKLSKQNYEGKEGQSGQGEDNSEGQYLVPTAQQLQDQMGVAKSIAQNKLKQAKEYLKDSKQSLRKTQEGSSLRLSKQSKSSNQFHDFKRLDNLKDVLKYEERENVSSQYREATKTYFKILSNQSE